MGVEKLNPNFDINAKYEDIINVSKRIIEHHEFVSDGSCEPPSYICLAYDIKNYLPKLQQENQELKKQLEKKYKKVGTLTGELLYEENTKLINQQKEFIEWLEKEIEAIENKLNRYNELVKQGKETDFEYYESIIDERKLDIYIRTLKKYKEIVGGEDE